MDKQMFVRILNSEMELATGCTEPGAVALTAAEAGAALRKAGGTRVEAVTVRASINIIKNAMSAGIPGTSYQGMDYAAAIGAVPMPTPSTSTPYPPAASVPLTIHAGDRVFVDDEHCDIDGMIAFLRTYKGKTTTSCPNTECWLKAFGNADTVYCVTISSAMSGTYNAAMLAAKEYMEGQ